MWRSRVISKLVTQLSPLRNIRAQSVLYSHSTKVQEEKPIQRTVNAAASFGNRFKNGTTRQGSEKSITKCHTGRDVSRKDKVGSLVRILMDLDDNKEAVYSALDSWVAWEQNFPIASIRRALIRLEKENQWRRVVHVIKWMLSKGQGTTVGTYAQLIRALDMDSRAEEAHEVWVKKLGIDLHSVPWNICHQMIALYYRNNMLDRQVKLFKGLEAYDRKPPDKLIVKKMADAYEKLGLPEEKERVLEKYKDLFTEKSPLKKSRSSSRKGGKSPRNKCESCKNDLHDAVDQRK